jgi:hypothetical protein
MLKSLQDRPARFARAGKIKLGIKVMGKGRDGQPVEIPKDVEYFVLPEELRKVYGDKPLMLPCRLPYDDPSMVFDASYQKWQGADLAVRCDEQTCWTRDQKGKPLESPCQKRPDTNECECGAKPMGRLLLLVPGGYVGVYEIRLTGYSRIAALWDQINQFREIFGRLREIPFFVTREARDSTYRDAAGKAHTREIHPVHLKCEWETLAQFAAGRQLAAAPAPEALPPAVAPEADDSPETADGASDVETAVITKAPETRETQDVIIEPGGFGRVVTRTIAVPEQLPYREEARVKPAVAPGPTQATEKLGAQQESPIVVSDWDVSMCVMAAVKNLGVTKEVYLKYLREVYGGEENMDSFHVSEQQDLLGRSGKDKKIADNLKKAIEMAARGSRLSSRR